MKKILIVCLCFLLHLNTAAQMLRGNSQLNGSYSSEEPIKGLDGVKFHFQTDGPVRSSPVAHQGKIYFGSADGNLYCINSNTGERIWAFKTDGAVQSTPTVANNNVYFSSRDGFVYAISISGKLSWKFRMKEDLPFQNGFDYFLSSPNVVNGTVYIGSGDGMLYALHAQTGRVVWSSKTNARIRTTPAIINDRIVFGGLDGVIYCINKADGSPIWRFETTGASDKFENYGYDPTSIICSPAVTEKYVFAGGRDGYLYALDLNSGKQIWKLSHGGSWVLSVSTDNQNVYAASGTAAFIQAVNIETGKEVWKYQARGIIYPTPIIVKDFIYCADYSGNLFCVDKKTGIRKWSYPLGARVFSTPLVYDHTIYAGADNGILFALAGSNREVQLNTKKVVYWQGNKSAGEYNTFPEGASISIREYFKNAGYEAADATQISKILRDLIESRQQSVIVFADNKFPQQLWDSSSGEALIRTYLNAGGKVVLLGANPLGFIRNTDTGQLTGLDFEAPIEKVFGIKMYDRDWMNVGSVYHSKPTPDGAKLGLRGWWVNASAIDRAQVSRVLAINEHGFATSWLKNYGGPEGSGLLQLSLPLGSRGQLHGDLFAPIQAVIEHGIDW